MRARQARLLFPGLFFLALLACTSNAPQPADILERHGAPAFPVGYEVQASLQLSRDGIVEHYLLAMGTATNKFSAAFLSPQGLPVYTVTWVDGRLRSARQAPMGTLLDPQQTLDYLLLIFARDTDVEALIQGGWMYQASAGKRKFNKGATVIDISYQGEGPWHRHATLDDRYSNFHLTVHILEAPLVLPQ